MIELKTDTINNIVNYLNGKKYVLNKQPFEVNIVGLRSDSTAANKFDDKLALFYFDGVNWVGFEYPITTDPGTYWLKKPVNVDGTAILKTGHYKYKIGLHKGQYKARVQRDKVTVLRDYDRNAILDFNTGKEVTGFFGINIHRATSSGTSTNVDKWSAGCQVFASSTDFKHFLNLVEQSENKYGEQSVYYTLIDQRAINRGTKRNITFFLILLFGINYFTKFIK
jgi:hypothetical protein